MGKKKGILTLDFSIGWLMVDVIRSSLMMKRLFLNNVESISEEILNFFEKLYSSPVGES